MKTAIVTGFPDKMLVRHLADFLLNKGYKVVGIIKRYIQFPTIVI